MPASSSFSVALSLGLLVRGKGGLAQMLLYVLEKGPKEKNYKTAEPWEISVILVQNICVFDQACGQDVWILTTLFFVSACVQVFFFNGSRRSPGQ